MKTWVPMALSVDLPNGVAMPGRIGNEDIALWRSASGHVQAWGDRCPHRGMRLSHGFVRGETLACIYHGWRYGVEGKCQHIPAHPSLVPPETIAAKTYHVHEAGGAIWGAASDAPFDGPMMEGYKSLRSLPVACSEEALRKNVDDHDGALLVDDLAILVQPLTRDTCQLHVLVRQAANTKHASARLEALRRMWEEGA